jgi:hypothetical protein
MNRDEIFERVVKSADDFGAGNPQQFQQFGTLLAKCRHEEIFYGLLKVFVGLTFASSATSTQPIIVQFLNSVITGFLFTLLWVIAPYASSYTPRLFHRKIARSI